MANPEVTINNAAVKAALSDEATKALPEGQLKAFVLTLAAAMSTGHHPEFVVRYAPVGVIEEWDKPSVTDDGPGDDWQPARPA